MLQSNEDQRNKIIDFLLFAGDEAIYALIIGMLRLNKNYILNSKGWNELFGLTK